jgi:hypothetical protein
MTSDAGHERQWDLSCRAMAYIIGVESHFHFSFRTAYLYDRLRYTVQRHLSDGRSSSQAFRNVFSASYLLGQTVTFDGVINYDRQSATSTGFDALHHRDPDGIISLCILSASHRVYHGCLCAW